LFESSTIDEARLTKIYDKYRTPEALHEAGGFKVTATQQLLPIFKASNDYKTLQDLIKANIPQLEKVLITLLREADKTGGLTDDDRWTKITDLAEPIYKEQIAKRGKLDRVYREAYTNNLQLLDTLQFYRYEKPTKKGGGIYSKFKFIEIKKLETNKAGNIVAVKWCLHPEFTNIAHTLIFVNTDKFLEIKNPNALMVATYINDSFVMSEPQTNRTIKGEPITREASRLADKAGLANNNVTTRYNLLTKALNELEQFKIINKWHTGNNDKNIQARDKQSLKITIYPSKNVSESHISKRLNVGQRQAEKAEQQARQDELKALVALNRKDLKEAKDGVNHNKYLAEDLGITEQQLDLMLVKPSKTIKPEPISDEMIKKIRELTRELGGVV